MHPLFTFGLKVFSEMDIYTIFSFIILSRMLELLL